MTKKFSFMNKMFEDKTTRERSKKQETRLAKTLKGHVAINSGATFGQNDVITDFCEIEAKTTNKDSFSVKRLDLVKMRKKCSTSKIPIFVVDFEQHQDSVAVISYDDLLLLIEQANHEE